MRFLTAAAMVLLSTESLAAQAAQLVSDIATARPIEGSWAYSSNPSGSEASFSNSAALPQLWVHCTRATRRVTISRSASAATSSISVWTSSLTRDIPASFNSTTGRLTIDLAPYDALLDAMATSRGRIGFTIDGQPTLVIPAWAEVAHVIEDCRA